MRTTKKQEGKKGEGMSYLEVAFLAFGFIVMLFILWFGIDIHNLRVDIEKIKKVMK